MLEVDELGHIDCFELTFTIAPDEAHLTLREPTGGMPAIKRIGRREP